MKLLKQFQVQFSESFSAYLQDKRNSYKPIHLRADDLIQAVNEFFHFGGKKFRPALFYYAYKSFGKKTDFDVMKFSYVFELFHIFALIHDDIIDNAELRRSHTTIHKKYGIHMGVLAGDFALTLADEIFSEMIFKSTFSEDIKARVINLFNRYKQDLLIGQYLDSVHVKDVNLIMRIKTAEYSFVRPVLFACILSGIPDDDCGKWEQILTRIGTAFQLKDDFEGICGDEKVTGKSTTSDISEGKNTKIISLFNKRASRESLTKFNTFFGVKTVEENHIKWFREELHNLMIDQDVRGEIEQECIWCRDALSRIEGGKTNLHGLLQELIEIIQVI